MKRFTFFLGLLMTLAVMSPFAETAPAPQLPTKKKETPSFRYNRQTLEKQADLVFRNVELKEVLNQLGEEHDLNFVVERGVPVVNVDLALKNVKLGDGLRALLGPHKLSFVVLDEWIYIASPLDAQQKQHNQLVDLEYDQASLERIIAEMSLAYVVNVTIEPRTSRKDLETPITLKLNSIPFRVAIGYICEMARLRMWSEDDGLHVGPIPIRDRTEFLANRLSASIDVDVGVVLFPLLLDQVGRMATGAEAALRPDKQVTILVDTDGFKEATGGAFNMERQSIAFAQKMANVPLRSVLDEICVQLDAGYVIRRSYIEIVPVKTLRKTLNHPFGPDSDFRKLVVRRFRGAPLHQALEEVSKADGRKVTLSPLAKKELETPITARLDDVPFEPAVALLAQMADLRVVRQADGLLVTTKEQAAANAEGESAETKAVAFIEKLKGKIERDDKAEGKPIVRVDLYGERVTDAALKELTPLKQLQRINLVGAKVTDAGLKELAAFKHLQGLGLLDADKVTDEGMKELAVLKRLQGLSLQGAKVTDAGLRQLAPLKQLQILDLSLTKVTDAGLKELAAFEQLQELRLDATLTADAGLKHLAGLKQLRHLHMAHTAVTDAGLKHLTNLKQLRSLDLAGTKVTDAGLKELAALKQLWSLNIEDTQITDAGLKELSPLKELVGLFLKGTKATDAGAAELKKALPECTIRR
jgi:internalin A